MSEQITLRYSNGPKDTAAAMIAGGATLGKRYRDWTYFALGSLVVTLVIFGGMLVGLALWIFVFDQSRNHLWLLPACGIPALLIYQQWFKRMIHAQAVMTIGSRFGRLPQTLVFDKTGVTQTNATATWQTAWPGVESVAKTKHGMALTISGIVIPIPDDAFIGGPTKHDVLDQLNVWHKAAQ